MAKLDYTIDDLFEQGEEPEVLAAPGGSANVLSLSSGSTPSNQNLFDAGPAAAIDNNEFVGNTIMNDGYFRSSNYVANTTGWNLTPSTGEFNFAISVDSLDIPDTTTANSFHVDSSGNSWWGANVATGYAGANAYVLATGAAVFKNIQVGGTTIQYVITNSGIFSFGDGSDGDVTISVDTTLAADKYYDDLTINTGCTLNPAGYRIFVKGILTINGTGKISGNGNDGTAGGNGTAGTNGAGTVAGGSAGTGGAALADGYLKGSLVGKDGQIGGVGGSGAAGVAGVGGTNGTGTTNSLGSNGGAGGAGGAGGDGTNGAGARAGGGSSSGGTATTANVKLIANWHLATLLDISSTGSTVKFDNSGSGGSGGSGGGGNSDTTAKGGGGGGSGGSGSAGRIVAIYARSIVVGASASITANGGAGGNGGNGGDGYQSASPCGGGGGGGGGAGGAGGILILTYNTLSNSGTISANAGTAGTGGTAGANSGSGSSPVAGSDGATGAAGVIYQFQLSL